MMFIIRDGSSLYETDNYEEIQLTFEGYLYGSHRGKDVNEKVYDMEDKQLYEDILREEAMNKTIQSILK